MLGIPSEGCRVCHVQLTSCIQRCLYTAELDEGEKPAKTVVDKPPKGMAAVGWGQWQFFGPAGDRDDEADNDEQEEDQAGWYRGVVYWYDDRKKEYWVSWGWGGQPGSL